MRFLLRRPSMNSAEVHTDLLCLLSCSQKSSIGVKNVGVSLVKALWLAPFEFASGLFDEFIEPILSCVSLNAMYFISFMGRKRRISRNMGPISRKLMIRKKNCLKRSKNMFFSVGCFRFR